MKTLYLLRHAKSSWTDPDLEDFDRPLNERGERDAPRMGKRLRKHDIHPDIIFSSPALRAITTALIIAENLDYGQERIHQEKSLYHASGTTLLNFVKNVPNVYHQILIVGHNPGLTEFTNSLIKDTVDNIPTAGFVAIGFPIDSWNDMAFNGTLVLFEFPKR